MQEMLTSAALEGATRREHAEVCEVESRLASLSIAGQPECVRRRQAVLAGVRSRRGSAAVLLPVGQHFRLSSEAQAC